MFQPGFNESPLPRAVKRRLRMCGGQKKGQGRGPIPSPPARAEKQRLLASVSPAGMCRRSAGARGALSPLASPLFCSDDCANCLHSPELPVRSHPGRLSNRAHRRHCFKRTNSCRLALTGPRALRTVTALWGHKVCKRGP